MDKSRKRSLTRVKSPAGRKTSTGKSPGRSRSKTGGQHNKKDAKARGRSKSRTKKDTRSRSRGRVKSKSPAPRTRSRTRRSTSRSRGSSRSRIPEYSPSVVITRSNSVTPGPVDSEPFQKKPNLVLQDVYHGDYIQDSVYQDIIRRSLSRDIPEEKNSSITRRYASLVREASVQKEPDEIVKDVQTAIPSIAIPPVPRKKAFSIAVPKWLRALIGILIVPPLILLIHLACTKEKCTLSKFHIHRNMNLYLNTQSAIIVGSFVIVQTILSLLSIGKKVGGPPSINGTLMYRCNGLLSTFISAGIVAALWHYNYPVTIVLEKMISMIVASTIFGYILSIILFIKGGRAPVSCLNPKGMDENRLYQFFVGREINPFFFGRINVKTLLLRISLNGLVIMNGLLTLRAYAAKHELNYTLLACVGLMTFLVIEFFWFEDSFPSTFEAMYEGTGCYLCLSYMLFPFFPTLITKYIIQHKVEVPVYGLAAIATFFVIGYVIYRSSNLQKAAFRRNPLNPALAHLEAIPTSRGKKLLVTSWWGFVRHPNYLGSIILHWAWASTAGYAHAIPYAFPLLTTLILMNRARRVDVHCSDRYQKSWDEYCHRVPHRIIPRVF